MADQEHTLVEAAKLMEPSRKAGVVRQYAQSSIILRDAPVINTEGKASYHWTLDAGLPYTTGGSRNVGSDFDATQSKTAPFDAPIKIYGGKIKVDEYIIDHSPASIQNQEMGQIAAYARRLDIDVFEGAGGSSLYGVQSWITDNEFYSDQVIDATAGSTSDVDMDMMDELVEKVDRTDNTVIYMNEYPWRKLKAAARGNGSTDQRINYGPTQFGMWMPMYDGIPLAVMRDGAGSNMFSVTETAADGGSDATSIYVVAWGLESATLFASVGQVSANGVPLPKLTKENDGSNFKYERLTWYVGFAPQKPRCIARLRYVKPS